MDWQLGELNAAWRYAFLALVRRHPGFDDPAQVAHSVSAWNAQMLLLDARLAESGRFVAGADFTLADVVIGLCVHRWRSSPIAHVPVPNVEAYAERLRERPAFRTLATPELP